MQNKDESVWKSYEKFKKDYDLTLKNNKTCSEIVQEIMKDRGFTIEKLVEKSKLSTQTVHRLRSGRMKNNKGMETEYLPNHKTIIAFSIACELDMLMTITLLESLGYGFRRTSEVHYAYCYLIVHCRGESIDECNKALEKLGIAEPYHLRNFTR
ncbi:MAG: helix-turn-helix transcriptional regulator [Defluviitaleaceae bacterium]|nr:helix-turn-helix transcriptional regulator [Defluviitaleaceae bacterium]